MLKCGQFVVAYCHCKETLCCCFQ